MKRMYGCFPTVPPGPKTWPTWAAGEEGQVEHVLAEVPCHAAELWALVAWERHEENGIVDILTWEVCVRDGDAVRRFDVTIELTPRALVQELAPFVDRAAPAGGAR